MDHSNYMHCTCEYDRAQAAKVPILMEEIERLRDVVGYWQDVAEHYRQLKEMRRAELFAAKGLEFHREAI